ADGKLYFRYQGGTMALIEATPERFNLISKFEIPDVNSPSWPHPVIAGGKLYLREQDSLLCYKLK
ncbi:MAG TPA: polyvinylalcohol dehydrogenase, partial [Pirellulales bacterium]|nr:polyvinylalcohol dehydrogenase [Pirellulales bacterium]